ncbi:MAG: hypothetical protein JW836_15570 [Deltaproteobacteria bacterium]|nr:hypothetical protein [Deltaproteobacteria bacterium]
MMQAIRKRFSKGLPPPIYAQRFIGETISQIYSPFYVNGRLYDAVLNRPINSRPLEGVDIKALPESTPNWQIQFIPAQCPTCGWDLEGERDSIVLTCRNCSSLWIQAKKGFRKLEFGSVPAEKEQAVYLPFYCIEPEITGIQLDSYTDLIRVANLPKVIQKGMDERLFQFWSPAFKIRPLDFMRFSTALTLSQPRKNWEPRIPETEVYPVTLAADEALESLKISLACFMKPSGLLLPTLREIQIKAKSFVLVYFPFQTQKNEIFHTSFRLRTTRNMLNYARHL